MGALLQLALAGVVLILLGIAASQASRDPANEDAIPMMDDTTGYDFEDVIPFDEEPADTLPLDGPPADPDTTVADTPPFTPGA